ncbi:MAG: hypothetical protein ACK6D7_07195 [Acidobacteriota bacterium]
MRSRKTTPPKVRAAWRRRGSQGLAGCSQRRSSPRAASMAAPQENRTMAMEGLRALSISGRRL